MNRIAAGEALRDIGTAVKELVENSLDAGATSISVTVEHAGFTIVDNGCGIARSDFPLVAERFATSKLRAFDDLVDISTFGFRGEALASVSFVGDLTITSKTETGDCATGHYRDSKLLKVIETAGNRGTIVHVENLFADLPSRQQSLSSAVVSVRRVLSAYAFHYERVAFELRSSSENTKMVFSLPTPRTCAASITVLYGKTLKNYVESGGAEEGSRWRVIHSSCVTGGRSSGKGTHISLIFVNGRLVEVPALKNALQSELFSDLPRGAQTFCYASLQVPGNEVEVNVHPSKNRVSLSFEDKLISHIASAVDRSHALSDLTTTKTFKTKTVRVATRERVDGSQLLLSQVSQATRQSFTHPISVIGVISTHAVLAQYRANLVVMHVLPILALMCGRKKARPCHLPVQVDGRVAELLQSIDNPEFLFSDGVVKVCPDGANLPSFDMVDFLQRLALYSALQIEQPLPRAMSEAMVESLTLETLENFVFGSFKSELSALSEEEVNSWSEVVSNTQQMFQAFER